jgi:hypothetical protein
VKRNVEKWSKTGPRFAELKYIAQRSIPVTLEEIAILNQRLKESITCTKQDLIRDINDKRIKRGDIPIPQTTHYRLINNLTDVLTNGASQELHWLVVQGIEAADTYDLADVRATLSNIFTYSGLKTFGGIDIDGIALGRCSKMVSTNISKCRPF